MRLRVLPLLLSVLLVAALAWGAIHAMRLGAVAASDPIPTTRVKKGRVVITVSARGELQGGNSEMLTAPMVGGSDLVSTAFEMPGNW
jgi:hypothetical protein